MPVIVKSWPRRQGLDDRELEEVWRHEIRQLHRLVSYPGASGRLTILQDSAQLDDAFHLMLTNDHRLPLQRRLEDPRGGEWFRSPRTARNRVRLWQEIARIAEGLEILHSQGLLHRNIDTWSILTSAGDEPDFLLSGFEWSIRIRSAAAGRQRRRAGTSAHRTTRYSFYEDWRAIGVLACRLLNFPNRARASEPYFPDVEQEAGFLHAPERDLLTLLLAADPMTRLDAAVVLGRIDTAVDALRAELTGGQPRLVLGVGLGPASDLSVAIQRASDGEFEDEAEQLLFIRQDLGEQPTLVRLKGSEAHVPPQYALRGRCLTYRLRPYTPNGGAPTWSIARCYDADRIPPGHARIDQSRQLGGMPLDVMSMREVHANASRLIGATTKWDSALGKPPADPLATALQDNTYGALALFQVVEMLLEASEIWPVTVTRESTSGTNVQLVLEVRRDEVLDKLSSALDLKPPGVRLKRLVEEEQAGTEGEWRLTEEPVLGIRGGDRTPWRLVDIDLQARPPRYTLTSDGPPPGGSDLYLRAGGDGQDRLLQRKLKALRALREHGELLEMLASPRLRRRESQDQWRLDYLEGALDPSKMKALRELWAVLPLYLLQGPPGVGKTKLVEELVAARMGTDGAERLLLTAQSHAAVDHLLDKVRTVLDRRRDRSRPDPNLAVRCRPRDHGSGRSEWDLTARATAIANDLAGSELAQEAPAHIAKRIHGLVATLDAAGDTKEKGRQSVARAPDLSFQSLLLRSANLVFASTTARQLETLVEERAQFDWSIVEEAGKATGADLLAPLLLSHRRLMIGDHRQLPPFNSEKLEKLLAAPDRLSKGVELARHLLARAFRQAGIEEALDFVANADIEALSGRARSMMMLFETLIEDQLAKPPRTGRLAMARQLDQQHRMHPAIAGLVAAAFYPDALHTPDDVREKFETKSPPLEFAGSVMGASPVVFVDMPFAHAIVGGSSPEMTPRWKNYAEVNACVEVLRRVRAAGGCRPEVAVLAPYRAQRNAIDDRIAEERRRGALPNLAGLEAVSGQVCHTVDSFQGNEADIVIISLVRNNAHSGVKSLGFLSDPRRMNVLMSRARWRLVLVGSLDFLRARFHPDLPADENDRLSFLRRWLDAFETLRAGDRGQKSQARIVPITDLLGETL